MQTLSPQYTTLYTRKFRVFFSDLVVLKPGFYGIKMFTMPRNWEVIGVKMWLRGTFVRAGGTSCVISATWGPGLLPSNANNRRYGFLNGFAVPTDNSGILHGFLTRANTAAVPPTNYISNQSTDNEVWCLAGHNIIAGNPLYTAGYIDIWVITAAMP